MNLNLTDSQKQLLVNAVIALVIVVAALFGYNVSFSPMPAAAPTDAAVGAQSVAGPKFLNARLDGNTYADGDVSVTGDTAVGGDLAVTGDGSVGGDLTVTGVITTDGGYVGLTPVATATARPHWCGAQSVNGSATVIPATLTAAGVTTPRAPVASLGSDITLDANQVTVANASGVVTLNVWQLRTAATTTPQAATTPVTVNYCVDGN